jgi:hypothetical protein
MSQILEINIYRIHFSIFLKDKKKSERALVATAAKSNLLCAPPLVVIINIKGLFNSAKDLLQVLHVMLTTGSTIRIVLLFFSEK